METVLGTNWIALGSLLFAVVVQTGALSWWLGRKLSQHDLSLATAISSEREARGREIAAHARLMASDVEKAKAEARAARARADEVRLEVAEAFRGYPTKEDMGQMLAARIDPISKALDRLLAIAPAATAPMAPTQRRKPK